MSAQTDYWLDQASKTAGVTNHNYTPTQQQQVSESITVPTIQPPTLAQIPQYAQGNEAWNTSVNNNRDAMTRSMNASEDRLDTYNNSLIGQADPYIKGGTALIGGVASLASIYTGLETLKLQKKADARSDEAWALQKEELSRVKGVRAKNEAKMTKMRSDPNSMYYEK